MRGGPPGPGVYRQGVGSSVPDPSAPGSPNWTGCYGMTRRGRYPPLLVCKRTLLASGRDGGDNQGAAKGKGHTTGLSARWHTHVVARHPAQLAQRVRGDEIGVAATPPCRQSPAEEGKL